MSEQAVTHEFSPEAAETKDFEYPMCQKLLLFDGAQNENEILDFKIVACSG